MLSLLTGFLAPQTFFLLGIYVLGLAIWRRLGRIERRLGLDKRV